MLGKFGTQSGYMIRNRATGAQLGRATTTLVTIDMQARFLSACRQWGPPGGVFFSTPTHPPTNLVTINMQAR